MMNIIVQINVLKEIFYITNEENVLYLWKGGWKKKEREKENNGNIFFLDVLVDS